MPRKTTDSALSPQQVVVLEALIGGSTVTDAAQSAGVDRTTVHRWLREDFNFRAAYNQCLADLREAAQSRITALADSALDVVSESLNQRDAKTAIAVLRGIGLLPGHIVPIGPGDPQAVAERAALDAILGR